MKKVFLYLSVLTLCFVIGGYGLNQGYKYFGGSPEDNAGTEIGTRAMTSALRGADTLERDAVGSRENDTEQPRDSDDQKITADTKMVYEYYYTLDNISERTEELAPYFMIGVTRDRIVEMFTGWDVVSFSQEEVVMRKYINERSIQHYTVGVKDGYVAIFYEGGSNAGALKELTDKPAKTLSESQQKRLAEGISIKGDDMLVKALEDYGS